MMTKNTIALCLLTSSLTACQMLPNMPKPWHHWFSHQTTYSATLVDPICGSGVILKDQTTRIMLDSNPSTGYSWRLAKSAQFFDVISSAYQQDPQHAGVVGSGVKQVFTLHARQVGAEKVTFEYVRPWETTAEPAKLQTCELKVVEW